MPLGNVECNQLEYPLLFGPSQPSSSVKVFSSIRAGTFLGDRPVRLSYTRPWALDLPSAWTTSKAPLSCKSDGSFRMPGYLALPVIITQPEPAQGTCLSRSVMDKEMTLHFPPIWTHTASGGILEMAFSPGSHSIWRFGLDSHTSWSSRRNV